MRICYVFPSRERPQKFFRCLDIIQDMSESKDYFVWAKLDSDDPAKEEYEKRLQEYPELTVKWGLSRNKVHAINRDLEDLPECDIIIIQSDDMIWEFFEFDNEIRQSFAKHFPQLDGAIHYPDSHALDRTITLSILGINLYKTLGYLYFPEYDNVYPDNDFTELVRRMNKYVFVDKKIFDHYHPIWNMCAWDEQYRRTEAAEGYQKDHQTFLKRKVNNFGLQ